MPKVCCSSFFFDFASFGARGRTYVAASSFRSAAVGFRTGLAVGWGCFGFAADHFRFAVDHFRFGFAVTRIVRN